MFISLSLQVRGIPINMSSFTIKLTELNSFFFCFVGWMLTGLLRNIFFYDLKVV